MDRARPLCFLAAVFCVALCPRAAVAGSAQPARSLADALAADDLGAAFTIMERLAAAGGIGAEETLVSAFASPNAWVRRAALRALALMGSAKAAAVCVKAMQDVDALVRRDACSVSVRLASNGGKDAIVNALVKRLNDRRRGVRAEAVAALGAIRDGRALGALEAVARQDDKALVRAAAVRALGRVGGPRAALAARDVLETDDDDRVREASAIALSWTAPEGVAEILGRSLRDLSGRVRVAAAAGLGTVGTPAAVETLQKALGLPDTDVQTEVIRSLGRIASPPARAALRKVLQDRSSLVRRSAAETLGHLADTDSFDALMHLVGDRDPSVRAAAVEAVGRFADPKGADAARVGLTDRSAEVRARAAEAIGRVGDVASLKALVSLARPIFSEGERVAAIAAIGFLGDTRAQGVLETLLRDGSEPVRRAAASALAHLGVGGEKLADQTDAFSGAARVDFLGSLALLRVNRARKLFETDLQGAPQGSAVRFACEVGLYLLGDGARRQVVWNGARGGVRGGNPAMAVSALILAKDGKVQALIEQILKSASPALREAAVLGLGVARPAWGEKLLRRAVADSSRGVALRGRVALRWLTVRGPRK
jgi:HEAT repeat protein